MGRQERKGGEEDVEQPDVVHYVGGLDDIEGSGCGVGEVVIPAVKGETGGVPWRNGEVCWYFPSAGVVKESFGKKESVADEDSDFELSGLALKERTKVLEPTKEL